MPSTPRAVEMGAAPGSSLRTPRPSERPYSCHPAPASTRSPSANPSCRDATTRPTVPPVITSPSSTGAAYDGPAFMRPRM